MPVRYQATSQQSSLLERLRLSGRSHVCCTRTPGVLKGTMYKSNLIMRMMQYENMTRSICKSSDNFPHSKYINKYYIQWELNRASRISFFYSSIWLDNIVWSGNGLIRSLLVTGPGIQCTIIFSTKPSYSVNKLHWLVFPSNAKLSCFIPSISPKLQINALS